MRKYRVDDERKIRMQHLVQEWARSGLLEKMQQERIVPDLNVNLRRTNLFLRLILFGFGILILAAVVVWVAITLKIRNDTSVAAFCFLAAAACLAMAEFCISKFKLYRFGVEEAAAAGSAILFGVAGGVFAASTHYRWSAEFPGFVGLVVGAAGACWAYLRFGYLYAAIASMVCLSMAPFQTPLPVALQHGVAAGLLAGVFVFARYKHGECGDEFPGDEYAGIQALAWAGIYGFLNLQISQLRLFYSVPSYSGPFYWLTFVMIWILPVIGLYLAIRGKDRLLLDVNIALALATLITNKPYLGLTRQTWDPILFGLALIAASVGLGRWFSKREPRGFTSARLLSSDKRRLSLVATASAALQAGPAPGSGVPAHQKFEGGGGNSGGAGASGSF